MDNPKPPPGLAIGSKVYVYQRTGRGARTLEDYRRAWHEQVIVTENRRSWIVGPEGWRPERCDLKIVKCTGECKERVRYSLDGIEQEWADMQWESTHRYRIANALKNVDLETLRKVAVLIGYREDQGRPS
jgi:hypothetical protein